MTTADLPIKVCLLNDHLGYGGTALHGVSRYFLNVVPNFDRALIDGRVAILRRRDALVRAFEEQRIPVEFLGYRHVFPTAVIRLRRLIFREGFRVIHAQGYASTTLARMVKPLSGVGVVIHSHDADDNYPSWMRLPDRLLSGVEDAALAVSRDALKFFELQRLIPGGSTELLYNGIDLAKIAVVSDAEVAALRTELALAPDNVVILTVTRFRPEKGNEVLLRAVPRILQSHPNAIVVFVGDGSDLDAARRMAGTLGIENSVRFPGFRSDIPAFFKLASVAVMPSLREGTPYALLEALAMGVPLVASRVGGLAEILTDNETGRLVAASDPSALAAAISEVLAQDDFAAHLVEAGNKLIQAFNVNAHVRRLEEIYLKAAGVGGRQSRV